MNMLPVLKVTNKWLMIPVFIYVYNFKMLIVCLNSAEIMDLSRIVEVYRILFKKI